MGRFFSLVVAFFNISSRNPNAQCTEPEECVLRIPPRASLEKQMLSGSRDVPEPGRAAGTAKAQPRHSCTCSAHLQSHQSTPSSGQECAHSAVWILPPARGRKPNH